MNISRRDFLKGSVAGAMGLAVAGLVPGAAAVAQAEDAPAVINAQEAISKLNPQDYDYRSTDTDLSHVFSPWQLGKIKLNHRMVKSAAGSDTGANPDEFLAYYEAFADGGVEMIWVEDFVELYNNFSNPRKLPKENVPLKELADRLHAKGAYVGYQLSCMGQKFSGALLENYEDLVEILELLEDRSIPTVLIREVLSSQNINSRDDLVNILGEAGISLDEEQSDLLDRIYTQDSVVLISSAQVEAFRAEVEKETGMSPEEWMDKIRTERDAIEAGEEVDFELNPDQFGTVRRAYTDNKTAILRIVSLLEENLPALKDMLKSTRKTIEDLNGKLSELEEAESKLRDGLDLLETAGAQIEIGEQALAEGRAQLEQSRRNQLDKAEELENQKRDLDLKEEELRRLSEENDQLQSLEEQERAVRSALLAREEIFSKTEAGEKLLPASESWIRELKQASEENYRRRFAAGILMLLTTLTAIAALPAAFREKGTAFCAFLTIICLASSTAALTLLLRMGRGISYAALLCGALALLQTAGMILPRLRSREGKPE